MIKMFKKAQSSTEFLILVSFLFVIFVAFILVISKLGGDIQRERTSNLLEDVGEVIDAEIKLALKVSDGYEREFYLPLKLDGKEYEIEYRQNLGLGEIIIRYDPSLNMNKEYFFVVPKDVVVNSIAPGKNLIKRTEEGVFIN